MSCFKKILFFLFSFGLFLASCKKNAEVTEIKIVLLNPERFYGKRVTLQGKMELGSSDAFFNLTDHTGMITVTTENIFHKTNCQNGNSLIVVGRLKQIENRNYFSAEEIPACW